jgi:hypothetical protein
MLILLVLFTLCSHPLIPLLSHMFHDYFETCNLHSFKFYYEVQICHSAGIYHKVHFQHRYPGWLVLWPMYRLSSVSVVGTVCVVHILCCYSVDFMNKGQETPTSSSPGMSHHTEIWYARQWYKTIIKMQPSCDQFCFSTIEIIKNLNTN